MLVVTEAPFALLDIGFALVMSQEKTYTDMGQRAVVVDNQLRSVLHPCRTALEA